MSSITEHIEMGKNNDDDSLHYLYLRFRSRMIGWANKELNSSQCRAFDAEDVVLEAYHRLCTGLVNGQYPYVENRYSFQSLLATLTIRRAIDRIKRENAAKRGNGYIHGESVFENQGIPGEGPSRFDDLKGPGITPLEETIIDEEFNHRIKALPPQLKDIAQKLLRGFTPREIARSLGCSVRSIEIKRKQIFEIWKQDLESN